MTYRQILAELEAANKWLSSLGIREQQDRIRKHMQRITQLEEARQAGKLAEASQGENGRLAMFSLTEAMEFLDIYSAFKDDPPTQLPQRLKNALDGPADLAAETDRSNLGRNTMFELNLAARLHRAGLPVLMRVNPDVLCQINGHPMYVQSKRPFKITKIDRNIKEAKKQLIRDLGGATDPNARGIIAISVSRVFNSGGKLFAGPDEGTAIKRLGDVVQELAETHGSAWRAVIDSRIIGILFHVITPAHIQDINLFTMAQYHVVFSLPDRPTDDVDLLGKLATAISSSP